MNKHVIVGTGLLAHELKHVLKDRAVMLGRREGVDLLTLGKTKRAIFTHCSALSIINCAAYTAVDKAELEPEVALAVNAFGAENIARIAAFARVPLVHFSTDAVFSSAQSRQGAPNELVDPQLPETSYGQSKLLGEKLVRATHPNTRILRVANLYGEAGRGWPSRLRDRLVAGEEIVAEDERRVAPTWARWVAEVAVELLERPGGTYHVCADGTGSWGDFAERMAVRLSVERKIIRQPMPRVAPIADVGRLSSLMLPMRGIAIPHWDDLLVQYLREPRTCTES